MTTTRMRAVFLVLVVLSVGAVIISPPRRAEAAPPFLVTSAGDADDGTCNSHCTLREAIAAANGNSNPAEQDVINFNIPGDGPHDIELQSALPLITQPLKIDGTTEPGTICSYPNRALKIHLVGGGTGNGLASSGVTVAVLGLSITGFAGSGITVSFSSGHEFRCNHIGVGPGGEAGGNNTGFRLSNSTGANFGGPDPADRNVVSDNDYGFVLTDSSNLVINGNYIGTTVNGSAALPNGVGIYGGGNSESSFLANVLVSTSAGVSLGRSQFGLVFESNIFNYAANGVTPIGPNTSLGISLFVSDTQVSTGHTIGGTDPGLANKIRAGTHGIALELDGSGSVSGVTIRGNQVKMESGRAISLLRTGQPTTTIPNDNLDGDTNGPNLLQNFPVVTSALPGTGVSGTLNSTASSTFTIDIYASASCTNKSAERYLGSVTGVGTNPSGNAVFNATTLGAFNLGEGITATATDAAGNTSELSACVVAASNAVPMITSTDPAGVVAGASDTLITVSGANFTPTTKVLWNEVEKATTFVNTTTLQFTATAAMIGNQFGGADIRIKDEDSTIGFAIWRSSSDVDCSDVADAADALALMKLLAGTAGPPICPEDANKSGGPANLADVVHIRREIANLVEPLKSNAPDPV